MIALLVFLILLSAFLSGSETALFSLSPLTIKSYHASKSPRLELIARLMQRPRDVLVTILILNILANILIQNTVSTIFDNFESLALKIFVPLVLTLFFGELLPKSFALPNHVQIAYKVAPTIYFSARILRWIRNPLAKLTSFISRVLFFFLREEKEISSDELRHVLQTSKEQKVLLPIEADLVGGALDLQQTQVKEHMRPRDEILYYDIQDPLLELVDLFVNREASRVPVCDGSLENLLGILSAKEYFFHKETLKNSKELIPLLQKPYYIPETTRAWTALRNLRERAIHLAIVVDEYGSICGLITQEDLIETVIGDIVDARDAKALYTRSSDDVIIASGKLELSEFKELFHRPLESKEHIVTLGGWLIEQLGDIPPTGTKYVNDHFLFYILSAEPNRIRRVYIRRLKK